jgi:NADPH-dependent curcumin reductase CurA
MPATHKEILYVEKPEGAVTERCFRLVEAPVPLPGEGQILARTSFLSIDPYFRRMMAGARDYPNPLKPGDRMVGRGCGIVVESRHPQFKTGDAVQGEFGWREHAVLDGHGLRKVEPDLQPLSLSLGLVGQSGATAWVGLNDIARMKAGDTVVVSAAAGAVGSVVGQIAKIMGCRAIGVAGGADKCRHVVGDLGFDECIDYKAGAIDTALAAAAPNGIDVYFDNVGGPILDAVLGQLRPFARIAICGMISQYQATEKSGLKNVGALLDMSATMTGFRIGQHLPRRDQALGELMEWWRQGRLKWRETVFDGIEQAPAAFINMLAGGNYGKQVVRVAR